MILVAGYCRVSTDHADQINSFESQQRYLHHISKENRIGNFMIFMPTKGLPEHQQRSVQNLTE